MPKVNVILPTYNHAEFLERAIQAAVKQDFDDYSLIIVNDGSTDGTAKILERWRDHPLITLITHPANRGLPAALNTGHRAGDAPYCMWISSDNVSYPNQVRTLYGKIIEGYDMVQGDWIVIMPDGSKKYKSIVGCTDAWGFANLCANHMYSRRVWETYNYDEQMQGMEDLKFYLQAFFHPFKIGHVDGYGVEYYKQPNSLTYRGDPKWSQKKARLYEEVVRPGIERMKQR